MKKFLKYNRVGNTQALLTLKEILVANKTNFRRIKKEKNK